MEYLLSAVESMGKLSGRFHVSKTLLESEHQRADRIPLNTKLSMFYGLLNTSTAIFS